MQTHIYTKKSLLLIVKSRASYTKHTAKKAIKYWHQIPTPKNHIDAGAYNLSVLKKPSKDPSILTQTQTQRRYPDYPNSITNLLNSEWDRQAY